MSVWPKPRAFDCSERRRHVIGKQLLPPRGMGETAPVPNTSKCPAILGLLVYAPPPISARSAVMKLTQARNVQMRLRPG
jgi:hypothetical protein